MVTIRKKAKKMGRREITKLLRAIPQALNGEGAYKARYIRSRFFAHLSNHFFTKLYQSFDDKSSGFADEFGNTWKPISERTKIYRKLTGEERRRYGLGANNGRGLLTMSEDREWRKIFARTFHILLNHMSAKEAKVQAAKVAWTHVKQMGARTKKETFKTRDATILVETGRLKASFAPSSIGAGIYKPNKDQIATFSGSKIEYGTKVPYASYVDKDRPLFPTPDQYSTWIQDGTNKAIIEILKELVENIE